MRLVLDLGANDITFAEVGSGGAFPYLLEVGDLRIAARAGYLAGLGSGESPSLAVALDNTGNRAAEIIGQPLRAAATVYDDDGSVYWSGIVSEAAYGRTIDLTIDA